MFYVNNIFPYFMSDVYFLFLLSATYFHNIVEALVSMGYERNTTIRGAPYDFRKAPSKHAHHSFPKFSKGALLLKALLASQKLLVKKLV